MNRLLFAFVLPVVFCLWSTSSVQAQESSIKKGVYNGVWQDLKMKLTIEKGPDKGKFSGIIHMDKKSAFPDLKIDFKGEIGKGGELIIHRINDEWKQEVKTGAPRRDGNYWVWKGKFTGPGTTKTQSFEVRIPR